MLTTNRNYQLFAIVAVFCVTLATVAAGQPATDPLVRATEKQADERNKIPQQTQVTWLNWATGVFSENVNKNKLILLRIMPKDCNECAKAEELHFADPRIVAILSKDIVPITVNAVKRPDFEVLYSKLMEFTIVSNKTAPMYVLTLPDGRPFWAGRPNNADEILQIFEYFLTNYQEYPTQINNVSESFLKRLGRQTTFGQNTNQPNAEHGLDVTQFAYFGNLVTRKVQSATNNSHTLSQLQLPSVYQMLLRQNYYNGDKDALAVVEHDLSAMVAGNTFDNVGGGFFQYPVRGSSWQPTNYDKSVANNAQMVSLLTEAFQNTKNPNYQVAVYQTLSFMERDLKNPNGSFNASIFGEERTAKAFYWWTQGDVAQALVTDLERKIFFDVFAVKDNRLVRSNKSYADVSSQYFITQDALIKLLDECNIKLVRYKTDMGVRLSTNKSTVTAWNAMVLKAFVDAHKVFGDEKHLQTALQTAQFLKKERVNASTGKILHDEELQDGFFSDYALTIEAFIALYEVTFDEKWLTLAQKSADFAIANFYSKENQCFYFSPTASNYLTNCAVRPIDDTDGRQPSANAIFAKALMQLSTYFHAEQYAKLSKQQLLRILPQMLATNEPEQYAHWSMVYSYWVYTPFEIAILGDDCHKVRLALAQNYLPNIMYLGGYKEGSLETLDSKYIEGETTIYVCQNKMCKMPTSSVEEALVLISE